MGTSAEHAASMAAIHAAHIAKQKWRVVYINGSTATIRRNGYEAARERAMQISKSPIRDLVLVG